MEISGMTTGNTRDDSPDRPPWEALEGDARQHSRWMFGLIFFTVLTVLPVVGYLIITDIHTRRALPVGFIGSSLGIIGVFISPHTGPTGVTMFNWKFVDILDMPVGDFVSEHGPKAIQNDERIRARVYEPVRARAAQESEGRLLQNRVLSIAVVTILSLVLWLVFHEPILAAVNEVLGLIITRAQYYSQPSAAMRSMESIGGKAPGFLSPVAYNFGACPAEERSAEPTEVGCS